MTDHKPTVSLSTRPQVSLSRAPRPVVRRQPPRPYARRPIPRGCWCDDAAFLWPWQFAPGEVANLGNRMVGKKIALIDYEPDNFLANDAEFARMIDLAHAVNPTIPVGCYGFPIVTCGANDAAIRDDMLHMTMTAARVDFMAADASCGLTADPVCARKQANDQREMFPGIPQVPVLKHRVYPEANGIPTAEFLHHIPEDQLEIQWTAALEGASAAIAWILDTYYFGIPSRNDPSEAAYKPAVERAIANEIPAGASMEKWLANVQQNALEQMRRILV